MVQPVELRATAAGVLWARRPLVSGSGLLSRVRNARLGASERRPARFRGVAFSAAGDSLAAVDERGRVFVLFVAANRYALVQHLGAPALACAFNPARASELLVTCENDLAHCIDVQTRALVGTLRGHRRPARCAAFHRSGRLALTASQDAVILWDTKDWSRYRVLNAGPGVEMVRGRCGTRHAGHSTYHRAMAPPPPSTGDVRVQGRPGRCLLPGRHRHDVGARDAGAPLPVLAPRTGNVARTADDFGLGRLPSRCREVHAVCRCFWACIDSWCCAQWKGTLHLRLGAGISDYHPNYRVASTDQRSCQCK